MIRRCTAIMVGAALLLSISGTGKAVEKQAAEFKVKAACLYNFLKFVDWPEGDRTLGGGGITIGVIGDDPFGDAFAGVENKPIRRKGKLRVKRIGPYREGMQLSGCHLLFVCASEQKNLERILAAVKGTPVLTVADTGGFLEAGGMILLVRSEQSIRWKINSRPARVAGLTLSSQLLRTASDVVDISR